MKITLKHRLLKLVEEENLLNLSKKTINKADLMAVKKSLNLSQEQINEADLINVVVPFLNEHPEITTVNLSNQSKKQKEITFAGLKALLSVQTIKTLNLSENQIDAECAKALEHAQVSNLDISLCHFTDEMLDVLKNNEHIETLSINAFLEDNKLTKSGIATLTTLPSLKNLEIASSTPDMDGCKLLAAMNLRSLNLNGCGITGEMFSVFRGNNSLVELSLYKNPIGDKGMEIIPTMTQLKKLIATSTKLTDAATVSIASSHSLNDVNIFNDDEATISTIKHLSASLGSTYYADATPPTQEEKDLRCQQKIQAHVDATYANHITNLGQRILAGNSQLTTCAAYFNDYDKGGYFGLFEDHDESTIAKMNFAKKQSASTPFPSLVEIGVFKFRKTLSDHPELVPQADISKLEPLFEEKAIQHNRRLGRHTR